MLAIAGRRGWLSESVFRAVEGHRVADALVAVTSETTR
jgi:hypothetical protein